MDAQDSSQRLPVAIITGFLGSGKTTLLNHLVKQPGMQATAVIINEFGEIGIDHLLVETSTELMVELNNGCICCTVRGDLADKLGSLAMWMDVGRIPRVERVVVETTGLADPAPIMHTLMTDPDLQQRYRLDRLVAVVDAVNGLTSLARFPEAAKQIAVADLLVFSKTDMIHGHPDRSGYELLKTRVRALNPRARLLEATHGAVDPGKLLGMPAGDPESVLAGLTESDPPPDANAADGACAAHLQGGPHPHEHDLREAGITSFVVELDKPVSRERLNLLLEELARDFGTRMLRMKGILQIEGSPDRPAVIQGVQHVLAPVTWLERWPDRTRQSKLVFITQDLAREIVLDRFRRYLDDPGLPPPAPGAADAGMSLVR